VELEPEIIENLTKRLARIEGQVRAVSRMIDEGRECRDVITQISAATTALEQVGFRLLSSGMQRCLRDPKRGAREGFTIDEVEQLFLKLS
jgi:DNA-binding FrmR family transcriptional regulator